MSDTVQRVLENGMTVRDLIEDLQTMEQDANVILICDYGDYHHTQQALPITSVNECETSDLHESAYSHSGIAMSDDCDDEDDEKFFCDKCEEEMKTKQCPKCNSICLKEDGTPAIFTEEEEDNLSVVVLNLNN